MTIITVHAPVAEAPLVHSASAHRRDDGFSDVDSALEAWARWGRSVLAGIGWPAWTLLARVIEQGFTGAAQKGGRVFEVDEAMERVERAVLRLSAIEKTVVTKHYLHWQPPEVSAQFCKISHGYFRVVLNRARRRVRDYLEGAREAGHHSGVTNN